MNTPRLTFRVIYRLPKGEDTWSDVTVTAGTAAEGRKAAKRVLKEIVDGAKGVHVAGTPSRIET